MNVLLVAMLAALWIWLLSPGVLRDRRPRSPIASIDSFERYMDILAPLSRLSTSGPDGTVRPPPRHSAAQRRRFLVTRLAVILAVTLAVSLTVGGWTWWLPLVPAVLLGAYLAALAEFYRRAELRARVSRLPGPEIAAIDRDETERQAQEA